MERLCRSKESFLKKKTTKKKTLYEPYRSRKVGPSAMAAAIHYRIYFLNMGRSIQSSLEISGLELVSGKDLNLYACRA